LRRAASPQQPVSSKKRDAVARLATRQELASALERHWGNLF
jgi:hypothetical protein